MIFRIIKPEWARSTIGGNPNPNFVKEIDGRDVIEGEFDKKFILECNKAGYNIYFFPNYAEPYSPASKWMSGKEVNVFTKVFVDMDLKDQRYQSKEEFINVLQQFKAPPSIIVDSGHGIHAYWNVSGLDRSTYMEFQFRLINQFKTDDSVWTPLQLMRYPGTINNKNFKEPLPCKIVSKIDKLYSIEELKAVLTPISEEQLYKINNHIEKLEGTENPLIVDSGELPEKFKQLMEKDLLVKTLFESPREYKKDRSTADMSLGNIMYSKGFSREEAYSVLLRTEKALSREGKDRLVYAQTIVNKIYTDRPKKIIKNISELNEQKIIDVGERVCGPTYFDCTEHGWRQRQVLGIISPPGVGKTTTCLNIVKECLLNTANSDSIAIYFSLEMTVGEIKDRWDTLVGDHPLFNDRFYLIGNEDYDTGESLHLNLQDIYNYATDTTRYTGKPISVIVIDHVNIISKIIDLRKYPKLGFINPSANPHKQQINIELADICEKLKELAKQLNCFLIIQSQTTKAKAGNGDQHLGLDAAFGTARFEWFVDYVMTCWQPLRPKYNETTLRVLAWKYDKIRKSSDKDKVTIGSNQLLGFNPKTGSLNPLTEEEYQLALAKLKEIRDQKIKDKKDGEAISYRNSPDIAKLRLLSNGTEQKNRKD
jgi:hypothetical protein